MEYINYILFAIAIILFILPKQSIADFFFYLLSKIIPSSTDSNKLVN